MRKLLLTLSAIFCLLISTIAQNRTITGRVTDANSQPIAGASVVVRGTRIGTTTSSTGNFSLNVPPGARTLQISSVNMTTQEVAIRGGSIDVALAASAGTNLQEVVVVGYGTQRKQNVTAAVATIGGEKFANVPLSSPDQVLQGKVAGVQSATFSGQPGANQQVRIRGIGSFAASSQPLYVVDGIQINSGDLSRETTTSNVLATMNSDDIESISVLKDAAATSIYGSRGSNGVILITTKKGRSGKTQFRVSAEAGQNRHGDIPSVGMPLRSADWLALFKESILNAGYTQATADATAANYGDGSVNTDWLSLLTRNGRQQQFNVSASGGDAKTKFYLSAGYFDQQANVIGSELKRFNATLNLDHSVSKRLSFSISLKPSYIDQPTPLSNSSAFSNPVMEFYFLRPTQNPYSADGSLNIGTAAKDFSSTYNPLYIIQHDIHSLHGVGLLSNAEIKLGITNKLSFSSKPGVQYNNLEEYYYNNPFHGDGKAANGRGYAYTTRYSLLDFSNQLDYADVNLTKNKDLKFNATVGYESIVSKGYFVSAQSQNFPTPSLTDAIIASTPTIGSNSGTDYSFASAFSRATLSYKNKYNLAGTLRRDGSSRFAPANQYGTFYSVSGSWNINRENFLSGFKSLSDLKLRASYGTTGNAEIGNYAARQTIGYGLNYNNQPGGGFNSIGNADLQWESSKQTDIGVDASFFNSRFGFTVDYYKKVIDHLLFPQPLSLTTGFSTITANIGAMQNTGIELTVNATPIKTRDFSWDISFNFTHNKNQVTKLPPGQTQVLNGSFILLPGQDIYQFNLRQWAGVDPANGDPLWYVDSSKKTTTNNYNAALRVATGKTATPKYYGGLSNTFTYKAFSISADFYYNYGNYVQDGWAAYFYDEVNPSYGKYTYNLQRWQKPGDITNVPKLVYGATNFSSSASTRFLFKGDFIRLRNISIGFNAPSSLTQKIHMNSLNFYVRGTNLWTKVYDKNIPFDPEQNINSQSNLNVFYNKAITAGVNIGF
jgi:TonB-linked SusC/RagA family outer membrane protein